MRERTQVQLSQLQDTLYELHDSLSDTNKVAANVAWFAAQDLDAIGVYDKMDKEEFEQADKAEDWKPMEFFKK